MLLYHVCIASFDQYPDTIKDQRLQCIFPHYFRWQKTYEHRFSRDIFIILGRDQIIQIHEPKIHPEAVITMNKLYTERKNRSEKKYGRDNNIFKLGTYFLLSTRKTNV